MTDAKIWVGLIAAAGSSERMGSCKALLKLPDERTFVGALKEALTTAGADYVVVTLPEGENAKAVNEEVKGPKVLAVANRHMEWGLAGSIVTALNRAAICRALVVCPVDMPFATAPLIGALLGALDQGALIARPRLGDRTGHPVAFSWKVFGDLRRVAPHGSARDVIAEHLKNEGEVVDVPWADPRVCVNINTPGAHREMLASGLGPK
jgi:molybdenum cofactor cytidylyltransferase